MDVAKRVKSICAASGAVQGTQLETFVGDVIAHAKRLCVAECASFRQELEDAASLATESGCPEVAQALHRLKVRVRDCTDLLNEGAATAEDSQVIGKVYALPVAALSREDIRERQQRRLPDVPAAAGGVM